MVKGIIKHTTLPRVECISNKHGVERVLSDEGKSQTCAESNAAINALRPHPGYSFPPANETSDLYVTAACLQNRFCSRHVHFQADYTGRSCSQNQDMYWEPNSQVCTFGSSIYCILEPFWPWSFDFSSKIQSTCDNDMSNRENRDAIDLIIVNILD